MARNFNQSRFGDADGGLAMGEDVNPSAYIVNLADCMLVLAVGFLVALVAYLKIDIAMTDLRGENLAQVDPATMPSDFASGGDYYVEAGKVYQDPQTGELYMVETAEGAVDAAGGATGAVPDQGQALGDESAAAGSGMPAAGPLDASAAGGASEDDIRNSRANGGD